MISKNLFCILAFACFCFTAFATSVNSGIYVKHTNSSISNKTSIPFFIHSSTDFSVLVLTTAPIYPNSSVSITWDSFAGFHEPATLVLTNLKDPNFLYNQITVNDNGIATIDLNDFGDLNTTPGYFNISVSNKFGSGSSKTFTVLSKDELKITLKKSRLRYGKQVGISWQPINTMGLANISIIRLSNGTVSSIESNMADSGFLN
ncbi:hypothetical protein DI09_387p10, partial [Mitosporidium daphniae]